MYGKHPNIETPGNSVKIWRYMDLSKLIALLEYNSLYFCRVDKLGDPFEGSLPKKHALDYFAGTEDQRKLAIGKLEKNGLPVDDQSKDALMNYSMANDFRNSVYVNCWHINNYESDAMWKLYQKEGEGVAIQSTVSRVKKSFQNTDVGVMIGRVKYLDYEKDEFKDRNLLTFSFAKRISFEHEKEVRLAITYTPKEQYANIDSDKLPKIPNDIIISDDYGLYAKVDIKQLINKIYINPLANEWLQAIVTKIINRYGLSISVEQSELNKLPLF